MSVEIFIALVKKAYSGLSGYAQERDFINTATKTYLKNIREDFGSVRVLGMKDAMPLDSLYVRANVLDKISIRIGDLPEEMEHNRELFLADFGKKLETIDGERIINRNENLIVLGKPGAGKTTYLKYLCLRMASRDEASVIIQRRLPIFVTLHEFSKCGKGLLDYMAEQFACCGFEDAKPFIERMLLNGDCMVLLDGLDEVSRESCLDTIIQEVTDFTRKYRESRFVVSCRIASYDHWFEKFKEVEIADFNQAQIEDFVGKYFQREPETAKACQQKFQENNRLLEMATSPLLLTLLCIIYDERQDFPPNRAMLYGRAMDALLNRWDASRRIQRDKLYKDLDETRLINLLSRLAAGYFESNVYFFSEDDLKKGIGQFLADMLGEQTRSKAGLVLQDIEQHYGLIVRRSQYAYSFSHLTFLEYFTAQYIVDKAVEGSVAGLVRDHFGDDRWLEVFLLVAGKMGYGADRLIELMHHKNRQNLMSSPELNELMRVIQEVVLPVKNDYHTIEREVSSLFFVLSPNLSYKLAQLLTIDLTKLLNLSRDLVLYRVLKRILAFIRHSTLEKTRGSSSDRYVAPDSDIDLAQNLGIDLDLITITSSLNREDSFWTTIKDYIKRGIWILQCINSGATISAPVKEKILSEMFKPV